MRKRITIGAVAGCLAVAGIAPTVASSHGTHLKAKMTGEQVVGDPGAPSGEGTAKLHVLKGKKQLCYNLSFSGIGSDKGLNAGVYTGKEGENGTEFIPLAGDVVVADNKGMEGCTTGVSKKKLKKLNANPHLYHLTVKTDKYPTDGAIRGQLKS
jgi:hypothetical protein